MTSARPSYLPAAGLALVAAALALSPIWHSTWWESHDMVAYPVRLIELCRSLRGGDLWPRWGIDLYGGRGAPLFNFYPPGALVPGVPLYLLGTTAYAAMKVSVLFYTALGLFAAFLVGELLTGRRDAGVVSLVGFATMPYRYTQLVIRGDLAEYCATSLAVLVLYAYLSIHLRGPTRRRCLLAACSHAGLMFTHTITGQWSTELLGLLVLAWMLAAWRRGRRHLVGTYALTFAGALGLMTIYVLPALWERPLVHIAQMATGHFATENNFVAELAFFTRPGFFFIGWAALLAFPLGLVVAARTARLDVLLWTAACVVLLVLMCPVSAPLWRFLPFGRYIMFPWRLLSLLSVVLCPLVALLWQVSLPQRSRATDAALLVVAAFLVCRTYVEQQRPNPVPDRAMPVDASDVSRQMHSTVVFNEYLPANVPHPPRGPSWNLIASLDPGITASMARRDGISAHVVVEAQGPGAVVLDRYAYPGWRARTKGEPRALLGESPKGLLQLTLPQAGAYDVTIDMGTTWDRALATLMTLATLLLLPLALRLWLRRRPAGVA